jgi:hypothetical protein
MTEMKEDPVVWTGLYGQLTDDVEVGLPPSAEVSYGKLFAIREAMSRSRAAELLRGARTFLHERGQMQIPAAIGQATGLHMLPLSIGERLCCVFAAGGGSKTLVEDFRVALRDAEAWVQEVEGAAEVCRGHANADGGM